MYARVYNHLWDNQQIFWEKTINDNYDKQNYHFSRLRLR